MKNIGTHISASRGARYTIPSRLCAEHRGRVAALCLSALAWAWGTRGAVTVALGQAQQQPEKSWSLDRQWDDGKAELVLYDAKRPAADFGGATLAAYEALFITVKEDLDPVKLVKTRNLGAKSAMANRTLPVLKLVQIHDSASAYSTQVYRSIAMVRRDAPSVLVKLMSSLESWDGSIFGQIVPPSAPPEQAQLVLRSYNQGDADRQIVWARGTIAEEQLPLFLRDFVEMTPATTAVERSFLPALVFGQGQANSGDERAALTVASFTFEGKERIPTGLGEVETARVRVRFSRSGKMQQQTWWMEVAPPHIPVKMVSQDGSFLLLRGRKRAAYWKEPTFRPLSRTP